MTRVQTVLITSTVLALVVPVAAAMAQTGGHPGTKCGAEGWSTDKMMYVSVPCVGAEATGGGTVGAATPTVAGPNSTTITKQEMKQGTAPVQTQAVSAGPGYASMANTSCGPSNVAAITDEYGHKYNCRGDRIR
ncbi:MAG: hypothetical protein J0J01_08715 [Reyranella sp.]|uniref:hypothetical protein n=1 Tax=Reyranella sp. TaxID=1929291 RepID=UPI001AD1D1FE|nr:hypothetical protein [Reyranella sp.]MBN9086975.1 hypothetical protein [Reyranella sp.]